MTISKWMTVLAVASLALPVAAADDPKKPLTPEEQKQQQILENPRPTSARRP
jgi:hypothetical protein